MIEMKKKIVLNNFETVYFHVVDADKVIEQRFRNEVKAHQVAKRYNGRVIRVVKRMVETLEVELETMKV